MSAMAAEAHEPRKPKADALGKARAPGPACPQSRRWRWSSMCRVVHKPRSSRNTGAQARPPARQCRSSQWATASGKGGL